MSKYIDAEKLIAEIERQQRRLTLLSNTEQVDVRRDCALQNGVYDNILGIITSLQQDKDVLELCSQVWWEDRGWIMIPPNVTLKGIESLLERVRHKIKWNEENGIEEQEQPESGSSEKPNNLLSEKQEQPEVDLEKEINRYCGTRDIRPVPDFMDAVARHFFELGLSARKEQSEIEPDKFIDKVDTFQRRYKHPEIMSIKGAMAFMARMFYQYPNVARKWYEQLPKATMD